MKLVEKIKGMNLLEKFKNKKVFALYLVGVLLLSTGISFAYFTARTNAEGEGGVATVTTTTVTSQGITADGNIDFNNVDMYPGHTAIASIRVTGRGNNEPLMYNVIFNGTNTFNTPLEFTVYKSDANIDASYSCEIKQDRLGTSKIYYEECTGNNIENLGTPISSGTINNGEGKTTLKSDEIILTSPEGEEVYYYIVIEYPNLDANQNDDMGSSISGNITIEQGNEYQKPQVILTGSTTAGSNGWVQSASITANITTHTRKYEAYYCTTTSDSCTPNTPANGSNNSFTTTLSSNASPQKVCVRVIDEYNQTTEGCSETYSVDTVNPTISITSTSSTENTISVTVNGSDAHSGISGYRFSSNGGSSYTDITTTDSSYTYTFNNLESGTSYNIAVQSIDRSGRTSSTVTRNVETDSSNAKDVILADNEINSGTPDFSQPATTDEGLWTAEDNLGTSYYFRGAVENNWVKFAGYYWRIIRINGNGSIRIIYSGNESSGPVTTGNETQIGISMFNSSANNNMYVGYMYQNGQVHGTDNNSQIKIMLESWYNNNLSNFDNYIDINAGFCNDRNTYSGSGTGSVGKTYYIAYNRLNSNKTPTLKCAMNDDLFTSNLSEVGNKKLTNSIGLITADEAAYAGGVATKANTSYYLYTGNWYWTMTPSVFNTTYAIEYTINDDGNVNYAWVVSSDWNLRKGVVDSNGGVRPVINLSADVSFSGSGTATDPYVVS